MHRRKSRDNFSGNRRREFFAFCIFCLLTPILRAADVSSIWVGGTGNWTDPANWNSNPNFPNNGNGGLSFDATVNGGTATLDQNIIVQIFTLGGGTVSGPGNLTIQQGLNWTSGELAGLGTTTITSGATLTVPNGNSQTLNRNLVIASGATSNWASSTNNSQWTLNNATITNQGTFGVNITGGTQYFRGVSGTNTINNTGSFIKQGAGNFIFDINSGNLAFNNSGTVDVQEGFLTLSGGNHTGDFTGSASGWLRLDGNHMLAVGSDITGALTTEFYRGTNTHNGMTNTTGPAIFSDGTWTVNGPLTAGSLKIEGGTAILNGTISAPGGVISSGTLSGSANWNVTGTLIWSGGTMDAGATTTITSGATLTVPNGNSQTLNRNLVIAPGATSNWASSTNNNQWNLNNATITNQGTFGVNILSGTQNFRGASGTNTINNTGSFIKQGEGTLIFEGIAINNTGSVDVQAGQLFLAQPAGIQSGQFNVASGAKLLFTGSINFGPTSTITGGGEVEFGNGSFAYLGNTNTAYGGANQLLTLTSNFLFFGAPGSTTPATTIWNGNVKLNDHTTFTMTTVAAAGQVNGVISGPGRLTLEGRFKLLGNNNYTGGTVFNSIANSGEMEVSGTVPGPVTINSGVTVKGSGVLGTTGSITVNQGATLEGGLRLVGNVTNNGHYKAQFLNGELNVNGNYTQNGTGKLSVTLIPNQSQPVLILGEANLKGTLAVDASQVGSLDGQFSLVQAQSFNPTSVPRITVTNAQGPVPSAFQAKWEPQGLFSFLVFQRIVFGGAQFPGDVNNTGSIDDEDIQIFATAMYDPDAFVAFPNGRVVYGLRYFFDLVKDPGNEGIVDFDDLQAFSALIAAETGSMQAAQSLLAAAIEVEAAKHVPEPETWLLFMLGMLGMFACKSRKFARRNAA